MCLFNSVVFLLVVQALISFSGTLVPVSQAIPLNGQNLNVLHIIARRHINTNSLQRLPRSASNSFATASSSASASSSSGSGYGTSFGGGDYDYSSFDPEVTLFSRFGEEEGTGVHATGSAQGPKKAFSSTSVSSDGGKVRYQVLSGKS